MMRGDLVELFRTELMRKHADDWTMDTVSEAAHICADALLEGDDGYLETMAVPRELTPRDEWEVWNPLHGFWQPNDVLWDSTDVAQVCRRRVTS